MNTDMKNIRPVVGRPLRELVQERLMDLLTEGVLEAGQDISESELAAALGVSRSPLREALLLLSQQGFIQNIPNRGFFVPEPDPARVSEIYPILAELECLALRNAANNGPFPVEELRQLLTRYNM